MKAIFGNKRRRLFFDISGRYISISSMVFLIVRTADLGTQHPISAPHWHRFDSKCS
jgi:hypothetical protein